VSWPDSSRAIYALVWGLEHKGVDARDKPGHDEFRMWIPPKQKGPGKTGAFDIRKTPKDQRE